MNEEIKKEIKNARLKYYEISNQMKVSQSTLYRMLNSNLTSKQKEKIRKAIREIKREMLNKYLKEA